jgi:hypothetical protein
MAAGIVLADEQVYHETGSYKITTWALANNRNNRLIS